MDRHTTRTALNAISEELDEHGALLVESAGKLDEILAIVLATSRAVADIQKQLGPALDKVQELPELRRRIAWLEGVARAQ